MGKKIFEHDRAKQIIIGIVVFALMVAMVNSPLAVAAPYKMGEPANQNGNREAAVDVGQTHMANPGPSEIAVTIPTIPELNTTLLTDTITGQYVGNGQTIPPVNDTELESNQTSDFVADIPPFVVIEETYNITLERISSQLRTPIANQMTWIQVVLKNNANHRLRNIRVIVNESRTDGTEKFLANLHFNEILPGKLGQSSFTWRPTVGMHILNVDIFYNEQHSLVKNEDSCSLFVIKNQSPVYNPAEHPGHSYDGPYAEWTIENGLTRVEPVQIWPGITAYEITLEHGVAPSPRKFIEQIHYQSITVKSTGTLELMSVPLLISCSFNGQYGITVDESGMLIIEGNSIIAPLTSSYAFFFRVDGTLEVQGISVSQPAAIYSPYGDVNDPTAPAGVIVRNNGVAMFDYAIVAQGQSHNIYVSDNAQVTIANSQINQAQFPYTGVGCGLYAIGNSRITVDDSTFNENGHSGIYLETPYAMLNDFQAWDNNYAGITMQSTGRFNPLWEPIYYQTSGEGHYLLWRDDQPVQDTWHIRWSGEGAYHAFDGVLTLSNQLDISSITMPGMLFPPDDYTLGPNTITFSSIEDANGVKGMDFRMLAPGPVTFDLSVDGVIDNERVYIGVTSSTPDSIPVTLGYQPVLKGNGVDINLQGPLTDQQGIVAICSAPYALDVVFASGNMGISTDSAPVIINCVFLGMVYGIMVGGGLNEECLSPLIQGCYFEAPFIPLSPSITPQIGLFYFTSGVVIGNTIVGAYPPPYINPHTPGDDTTGMKRIQVGIQCNGGTSHYVCDNTISDLHYGIVFFVGSGTIDNNYISQTRIGIHAVSSTTMISSNIIQDIQDYGIAITYNSDAPSVSQIDGNNLAYIGNMIYYTGAGFGIYCKESMIQASSNIIGHIDSDGPSSGCIYLINSIGCTITDNQFTDYTYGISLDNSPFTDVEYNIANIGYAGILSRNSEYNTFIGNTVGDSKYGICLDSSSYNELEDNEMVNDGIVIFGMSLETWNTHEISTTNTVNAKPVYYWKDDTGGAMPTDAGEVILANCIAILLDSLDVSDGSCGIEMGFCNEIYVSNVICDDNKVFGSAVWFSYGNVITDSLFYNNGNYGLWLYWSDYNTITSSTIETHNYYGLLLMSSLLNSVSGMDIIGNYVGVLIYGNNANENTITGNTLSGNNCGLEISAGFEPSPIENVIDRNIIEGNIFGLAGIGSSTTNYFTRNAITNNPECGIYFNFAFGYQVTGNIIEASEFGIYMMDDAGSHNIQANTITNSYYGVYYHMAWSHLEDNTISNNEFGVTLDLSAPTVANNRVLHNTIGLLLLDSQSSTITGNTIATSTSYGLLAHSSDSNTIQHNRFIDNYIQAEDDGTNIWDDGYPSGGNYWSDWTWPDLYDGAITPQTSGSPDGIVDYQYDVLGGANADLYPIADTTETINIPVVDGWNLISVPLVLFDSSVPDGLLDLYADTEWNQIEWYDASTPSNYWKIYYSEWPTSFNDFTSVNDEMGFWIHITEVGDGYITLHGEVPDNTIIHLYAGWNMVGYPAADGGVPYTVADLKADTGATIVEGFDPSQEYRTIVLPDTYQLKKGEGYWVQVPSNIDWTVDW